MTYLLDKVAAETQGRFAGLQACFDPTTFRHLTALGISPGWRCWELGAGSGSVSRWSRKPPIRFVTTVPGDARTRASRLSNRSDAM